MSEVRLQNEEIKKLIEAGATAPSGGNVQPWRVTVNDYTISVGLDPGRSDTVTDAGRFAAVMAVGSFCENVAILAHSLGLDFELAAENPGTALDFQAHFQFTARSEKGGISTHPLSAYIAERCTNRKPHKGPPIAESIIEDLRKATASAGSAYALYAVDGKGERAAVTEALGQADAIRMLNRALHDEMFSEVRWNEKHARDTRDGVDIKTLELPAPVVVAMKLMKSYRFVRRFVPRSVLAGTGKSALMASSHLCCLTIPNPFEIPNFFEAGRALQRMWLTAESHGISVFPWSVIPFFMIRARDLPGEVFNSQEAEEILEAGRRLCVAFGIPDTLFPACIFRLSVSAPPTAKALRLDWRTVTREPHGPAK